jgi:outer membrane protein assembly factor BamE (lipoprotein component of BamABCDE complex)
MKKLVMFFALTVLLCGCKSLYYTPYIDLEETSKLRPGLSSKDVFTRLGLPLFAKSGYRSTGEITWVYEIRSSLVRHTSGYASKISKEKKLSDPLCWLEVVFKNDKLDRWNELTDFARMKDTLAEDIDYEAPYINLDETSKLTFGMTSKQVLEKIGQPFYIRSGSATQNELGWVYEIRHILVEEGKDGPAKKSIKTIPSRPVFRMELVFVNDKLDRWEPVKK